MDLLAIGGLLDAGVKAADPYFYTEQEKARDQGAAAATAAGVTSSNNALAAVQGQQHIQEQAIKFGLLGVLGVGALYLAAQLVGSK